MKFLVSILLIIMIFQKSITIFDFNTDTDINDWSVTNDNVMGGISSSFTTLNREGNGIFAGKVSTENNGGFAMTRHVTSIHLKEGFEKLILRVKGDGKQYQFRIKSDKNQFYWYVQPFKTSTDWQLVTLDLKDFYPSFRGNRLRRANFSSNTIQEVAILIGNKKEENFKLTIDYIKVN